MQIRDILPVIIPGVLIQISVQVYYIKHCWDNTRLTLRQKIIYILAIIIFNLPAAAVYLFNNREKTTAHYDEFQDIDTDIHIRQVIFVLLVVAFEVFALYIITDNVHNAYYPLIIGLLAYCFIIMLINNLVIKEKPRLLYLLLPATQLFITIPIQYLDRSYNAQFILMVVAASIINKFPVPLARVYSIAAFCAFTVGSITKALKYHDTLNIDGIISYLYVNILVFFLVIAAFFTLKKQLVTNRRLNAALKRVREQSQQIREIGALTERHRITAEIHDTVGHTLTGAVISIEAAENLIGEASREAAQKLSLAKEQVKRGLDDIRSAVRTIRSGCESGFMDGIDNLLKEIYKTTGLRINSIVELNSELLSIQINILLKAVKECATNALKHSRCTEADLLIQEYNGAVRLTFSDNGAGTDNIVPGSGLSIMKERIESIGGTLAFRSVRGEGFTVSISLPVGDKRGGGPQ